MADVADGNDVFSDVDLGKLFESIPYPENLFSDDVDISTDISEEIRALEPSNSPLFSSRLDEIERFLLYEDGEVEEAPGAKGDFVSAFLLESLDERCSETGASHDGAGSEESGEQRIKEVGNYVDGVSDPEGGVERVEGVGVSVGGSPGGEVCAEQSKEMEVSCDGILSGGSDVQEKNEMEKGNSSDASCETGVQEKDEMEKGNSSDATNGGEDDTVSKKRKRQLRNRDSAMRSRERKKLYVRDLEIKSKFLEGECRRLEYAFRCCVAENQILRHQLESQRALSVSLPKQESAVLPLESLLLGSLFWLVSIVCLFLPLASLMAGNLLVRKLDHDVVEWTKTAGNEKEVALGLVLRLPLGSRLWKATRWKMKGVLHSVAVLI